MAAEQRKINLRKKNYRYFHFSVLPWKSMGLAKKNKNQDKARPG